jgi:hypothetical protein
MITRRKESGFVISVNFSLVLQSIVQTYTILSNFKTGYLQTLGKVQDLCVQGSEIIHFRLTDN